MANLDHVSLNNIKNTHYRLDVTDFQPVVRHSFAVYGYHRKE